MALAPDPSDKLDAQADGAFGGKPVNRRAGYGDRLEMALRFARKGACLSAGEGQLIVEHYEDEIVRLREQIAVSESIREAQVKELSGKLIECVEAMCEDGNEIARLERILAALREPSEAVLEAAEPAMFRSFDSRKDIVWLLQAAVAAAEQEVNGDQ